MTDEGPAGGETPAERDVRLAALLSVDISAAAEAHAERAARRRRGTATDAPVTDGPVPPSPTPDAGEDGAIGAEAEAAPSGPPWRTIVSFAVLIGLLAGGVGLAYAGARLIRSSTEGEVLRPIEDPAAPGFEALVDPTPTLVMLHDVDGKLDAITVLTLPDPEGGGGGVLLVPDRTVADLPTLGETTIEAAYEFGDAQIEAQAVGDLLGTAMREIEVVDTARWADLVAPVAPITVDNPNELTVDGEVRFPLGEIELAADEVGEYLEADDAEASDLARFARHQIFWDAWLAAVAEDGTPAAVPGELESGIGRFVRALSTGVAVIETLPVQPAAEGRHGEDPAFVPRGDEMEALVSRLVPFPASPSPGARARVRLLNGTEDTTVAASVAADLPPAGVSIVLIGNAVSLDAETTTVRYVGDEFRPVALELVEILGVGEVVEESRPSDAADITVTLGADYG